MIGQLPDINYLAIAPEICVAVTGLVVMLYDAFAPKESTRRETGYIALAGLAAAFAAVVVHWGGPAKTSFSGMLVTDPLRLFFAGIFLVVASISVLLAMHMLEDERLPCGEYITLLLFGTVGMLLMAGANDLALLFLGLETLSIATYSLAGFRRWDIRSNESALKYFILGSFSTGFLLYGIALTYGATRSTNLDRIQSAIAGGQLTSEPLLAIGLALMLVGLCFKVAAAPFHVWTPDVYQGAPTPVTAFMSAGPKAAAFAAFLRIFVFTVPEGNVVLHATWTNTVTVVAILSMVVGNVIAIAQTDIKRMLAYSSIAHAGYAMIGVLAGDWGSVGFYMLTYAVMNLGAFAVVGVLARSGDERTAIEDYAGIGFRSLGLSLLLAVFLLSLAGIPLTAGFMGKLVIFKMGWQAGYRDLVIVAVLNSAVSLYYYLRPIVVMFFTERKGDYVSPRVPGTVTAALVLTLAGVVYLGMFPERILGALETLSGNRTASIYSPNR